MSPFRSVVIEKVDLDTCLAGLLLQANLVSEVVVRPGGATTDELADPAVMCLEAGGAGDVGHGNFDHHGVDAPAEPACVQAAAVVGVTDLARLRLIDYVATLDLGLPFPRGQAGFPSLSHVFSGMLLVEKRGPIRFDRGMAILKAVIDLGVDPFGTMPPQPEWHAFVEAKREAQLALSADLAGARLFSSRSGARIGFVASLHPGALGALYALGCDYAIAFADRFLSDTGSTLRKFTVGSDGRRVDHLLRVLDAIELGWGGPSHGTIVGSPRHGSHLPVETVCSVVAEHC